MGDFNIDIFIKEITKKKKQEIDHIWANDPKNECKFGISKAYWSDFHKLIYTAFKLWNTLPMYNKKLLMFSFI